ncbi:hypothetical protein HY546_02815 [archaeon]|nr:hypothetical protein [archaeon]
MNQLTKDIRLHWSMPVLKLFTALLHEPTAEVKKRIVFDAFIRWRMRVCRWTYGSKSRTFALTVSVGLGADSYGQAMSLHFPVQLYLEDQTLLNKDNLDHTTLFDHEIVQQIRRNLFRMRLTLPRPSW